MSESTGPNGWPDPDEAKKVLRYAAARSRAPEEEFHAAMLGMLSTMIGPAQWAEAAARTITVFRDRQARP